MLDISYIEQELKDIRLINHIYFFDEITSTNEIAKKNIYKSNSLFLTNSQTNGKGRYERIWISEKNANLTFTLKLKLPYLINENYFLTYYTSYNLIIVLNNLLNKYINSNQGLIIKWPNDIYYYKKKIAGILIEHIKLSNEYLLGIGINCNQINFPPELNAASLKEISNSDIDISSLLVSFIKQFNSEYHFLLYKEFKTIYNKWLNYSNILGKKCKFQINNEIKYGIINNLNFNSSITIKSNDSLQTFFDSEIKIIEIN